ncbi:response regulator transcription factor, partial [Deinococcus detaillensis]
MRLLIVEDDPHIAELLSDGLTEEGYECDLAASAAEGEPLAQLFPYALLILDVMLPEGIDAGYQLGERLRDSGNKIPILYLTARGTVEDRVTGLEAGGDDYLTKPFAFTELRARIRALLRRASGNTQNAVPLPKGWMMDLGAREVYAAGVRADLTRREFALLELFVMNPGRAFGRDEIIERLWRGEGSVEHKVIDVYVSTLR